MRNQIRELDVERVELDRSAEPLDGAKAGSAFVVGNLVVARRVWRRS